MDFSLVLSIILSVLMCFFVPITCYIFCKRPVLDKFRNIFLVFYLIVLFVGVTSHLTISEGVVHLEYQFTKIWGNKDMLWGFENLTVLNAILNLLMLVPLGAYIASSKKEQKPVSSVF